MSVKVYEHINKSNDDVSFAITKMEDIYDARQGKADEAHRHSYFTVLIVFEATGRHIIDFCEYNLTNHQVYFISPEQVHQIEEHERSRGFVLTFSNDFLAKNNISEGFIDDLKLFNDFSESPPLHLDAKDCEKLKAYCTELLEIQTCNNPFQYEALGALLKLILIHCNIICDVHSDSNNHSMDNAHDLIRRFKHLIRQKFQVWHAVSDYADQLAVTPDHLNRVVKKITGKTAKNHIQSRVLIEAKRALYFSKSSLKEIAFALGFNDPANFSNFFKKHTGTTPSEFHH
ncbi:MAG: helix-turn-helix domain-containing protein [Flavobacteriales bacterium]|nr:helix-turn-helix domain-containing protein [Flavobacteriales bacterium]